MNRARPLVALVVLTALLSGAAAFQAAPSADLVLTGRMHHLRLGVAREWDEFPEQAEAAALGTSLRRVRQQERTDRAPAPSRPEAVVVRAGERPRSRLPAARRGGHDQLSRDSTRHADGRPQRAANLQPRHRGGRRADRRSDRHRSAEGRGDGGSDGGRLGARATWRTCGAEPHHRRRRARRAGVARQRDGRDARGEAGRRLQRHGRRAAAAARGPVRDLRRPRLRVRRGPHRGGSGEGRHRVAPPDHPPRSGHQRLGRDGYARAHGDVRAPWRRDHRRADADPRGRGHRAPRLVRAQHARRLRRGRTRGGRATVLHAGPGHGGDHAGARPLQRVPDPAARARHRSTVDGLGVASRIHRHRGRTPGDRAESRARRARRLQAARPPTGTSASRARIATAGRCRPTPWRSSTREPS